MKQIVLAIFIAVLVASGVVAQPIRAGLVNLATMVTGTLLTTNGGTGFAASDPTTQSWSWVNQGSATVTTSGPSIFLVAPTSATTSWRSRVKSTPSTPYTVTACIVPRALPVSFHRVALLWRDSATSRLITAEVSYDSTAALVDAPKFVLNKWTNDTTFSAEYFSIKLYPHNQYCFQLADTGVNRTVSYATDGQNFIQLHTVGRTDFLTANQIGFGADTNNTTYALGVKLTSWQEQ